MRPSRSLNSTTFAQMIALAAVMNHGRLEGSETRLLPTSGAHLRASLHRRLHPALNASLPTAPAYRHQPLATDDRLSGSIGI
jgi:hypothetical protein